MRVVRDKGDEIPQEIRQMAKVLRLTFLAMMDEGFTEDQAIKATTMMMVAGGAMAEEGNPPRPPGV